MRETKDQGEMEEKIQRHSFSVVHVRVNSHQRFTIKEKDKSPRVSNSNKTVSALDCENVSVSTKLGNKENQ